MVIEEALAGRVMCCKDKTTVCNGDSCAAWHPVFLLINVVRDGDSVWEKATTDYGFCGLAGAPMYPEEEIKLLEANTDGD